MTVTEALAQLKAAWPTAPISIGLDVWSHVHDRRRMEDDVMWNIWNGETSERWEHPTLAGAVALALGQGALSEVEAATDAHR